MGDCTDALYDEEAQIEMGQSDSKGAKKKTCVKATKGVSTSFGFRRRPASSSRAEHSLRHEPFDSNGNGGSMEDLCEAGDGADVISGRSTPLARPRKDTAGLPLRTNRFGFRQPGAAGKGRVCDVSVAAEEAFVCKDKLSSYNNNACDKSSAKRAGQGLSSLAKQAHSTTQATVVDATGVPKTVTKQTVILTYQTQQLHSPAHGASRKSNPRSSSASRATSHGAVQPGCKYSFQTNQLPRAQYPVRVVDSKTAKQMANNCRKISGSSDVSREGSATDSGVSTGGECGGDSPRAQRRRPRNLEMVMSGSHSFHLRELNDPDLDIMDEAVITDVAVIPLPKLPIHYDDARKPDPAYTVPSALVVRPSGRAPLAEDECSPMSTLERYRNRSRPSKTSAESNEEKFVLDRAQPEILDKQNSFIKSAAPQSPATVDSSKESSPSCKSDAATETWNNDAAGEAMANRSQDDVSACSTSSVEADAAEVIPRRTIVIEDAPQHPLLMKSLSASQHDSIRTILINSMSSSNYSGLSASTTTSLDPNQHTLAVDDLDMAELGLEASTQSLIDDETSPADSLISSATSSESECNNLAYTDREVGSLSSSAYQTANTKTKSDLRLDEDTVDGEVETPKDSEKASAVVDRSPQSPGTPTHASGSLSLSDGRDFFDDEIADQPGLLSMQRKNNEVSPSSQNGKDSDEQKSLRKSRERIASSPMSQRNRKAASTRAGSRSAERTASLDTLSSLASDDMMVMDGELLLSVASLHSVDDYIERLDSSFRSGLNSLSEQQLRAELSSSRLCAVQQWSQLLQQNSALDRQLAAQPARVGSAASLAEIQASLPVRTARLLQRSRAQTPTADGVGADATSPPAPPSLPPATAALLQDVVDIKTLLLRLKRVLHESETLDPLLSACAESPARGNGRRLPSPRDPAVSEHAAELRRQILYLQGQLEERDRLVRVLQQKMSKLADAAPPAHAAVAEDTCNVSTQTDRLRPPLTANLSNTENSGLVRI